MELDSSCWPTKEAAPGPPKSPPSCRLLLPDTLAALYGFEAQETCPLVTDLSHMELFSVLWTLERAEISWVSYILSWG